MSKLFVKNYRGSASTLFAIIAFFSIVILAIGYFVFLQFQSSALPVTASKTSASNSTTTNSFAILKPATLPPKIPECNAPLSYATNGNPSPIQCSNGALNIQAWNALAATEPTVMKLGYSPTQSQVESAICADANAANQFQSAAVTAPIETTAYKIASLYYGWHFSINAMAMINAGC